MYSYHVEQGLAGQTTYTLNFPILDRGHVYVYLEGDDPANQIAYTWPSETSDSTIELDVDTTERFVIRRITPKEDLFINFVNGAVLEEGNLDDGNLQSLYLIQEMSDGFFVDYGEEFNIFADLNMNSFKIINLGDGVEDTDALNQGQIKLLIESIFDENIGNVIVWTQENIAALWQTVGQLDGRLESLEGMFDSVSDILDDLESFNKLYLGQRAEFPSAYDNGDPLEGGALLWYIGTLQGAPAHGMYTWTGTGDPQVNTGWTAVIPEWVGGVRFHEYKNDTAGTVASFELPVPPDEIQVNVDGIIRRRSQVDLDGQIVTLTVPLAIGEIAEVMMFVATNYVASIAFWGAEPADTILALNTSGLEVGQSWYVTEDGTQPENIDWLVGHMIVWTAAGWVNIGEVQGEKGLPGSMGPAGPQGDEGDVGPIAVQIPISLDTIVDGNNVGQVRYTIAVGTDVQTVEVTIDGVTQERGEDPLNANDGAYFIDDAAGDIIELREPITNIGSVVTVTTQSTYGYQIGV